MRHKGFTLVEILIVVVLLGVLAAVVIPAVGKSGVAARQSTVAEQLAMLRRFMLVYKSHHKEVAPGYPDGDTGAEPSDAAFRAQATLSSNSSGVTAPRGTPGFGYGPYLSRIPTNPFNDSDAIEIIADDALFPDEPDGKSGWVCKPSTGEIRPGNTGTDERGTAYYDY
ncbi:MAG: prepilin-type N-terminal cleavage/methylation domain-containing protein [Longilinea sp.]|nr:prepilin-type N-terminal cleavage/methylation domain-containing protein [Longilinea sp.]